MNGDNQQSGGGGTPPGTPQVPPSPETPEIKLRTMESDVKSVEESGGGEPKPEYIDLPSGGLTQPPAGQLPTEAGTTAITPETPRSRGWLTWLIVIIVIVILGWLAYAYVWPIIFGPTEEIPEELQAQPGEPEAPVETPSAPAAASGRHQSLFGSSPEALTLVNLPDYTLVNILTAIQNEAAVIPSGGNIKEVTITDAQGPAAFSRLITALMPELAGGLENTLKNTFEDDFTAYIYYDDNGFWPGYVVRIKPNTNVDVVSLASQLQQLENAAFTNLFLTPPGESQDFRGGTIKGKYNNRYAPMGQAGASFNYGLYDQYLVITTSYNALLGALQLLEL